jgi:energy-coupling factor transport system substrate-specific component
LKLKIREIAIFAMLGAVMCVSKIIMELIPNVHLLGTFIVAFTLTYRVKALFPIGAYVFANGLWEGFSPFGWLPEVYIWLILWGAVMLLPKNMPEKLKPFVYMSVSALHGLLFGIFYIPPYLIFSGMEMQTVLPWIIVGLPYDLLHAVGNFSLGILILPLVKLLKKITPRN